MVPAALIRRVIATAFPRQNAGERDPAHPGDAYTNVSAIPPVPCDSEGEMCSLEDKNSDRDLFEDLVRRWEVAGDRAALIMSASTTTFVQNERVLCYHGPMIYEAKILKIDGWDETTGTVGPHFFVHYKGWKQTQVSVTLPLNDAQLLILVPL